MAFGVASFDELNALVGYKRSLPYEVYFGEMHLTDQQKKDRIALAMMLQDEFENILAEMYYSYPEVSEDIIDRLREQYWDVLAATGLVMMPETIGAGFASAVFDADRPQEQRFYDHVGRFSAEAVGTTVEHKEDPYYYSSDRAILMAENESSFIYGTDEFFDAVAEGYTHKTWLTMGDNKVRDSHSEVDGETLPIEEPFLVGGSVMMCPQDDSMGAGAEELVNCRCICEYSKGEDL